MHKLERSLACAPKCLADYDYRTQDWDNLHPECKQQVRAALVQMQGVPDVTTADANEYGVRCAYCEARIYHDGHIEHFRRKNKHRKDGYPELTFSWDNLFLSCGSREHCGHYKDRPGASTYDPDEIIKPDEHDPEFYLYFHSSGEVRSRQGLAKEDAHRANETIRVFGLNDSALKGKRARALRFYLKTIASDLDELDSCPSEFRVAYFLDEIEKARWEPYATTIKHFLQRLVK